MDSTPVDINKDRHSAQGSLDSNNTNGCLGAVASLQQQLDCFQARASLLTTLPPLPTTTATPSILGASTASVAQRFGWSHEGDGNGLEESANRNALELRLRVVERELEQTKLQAERERERLTGEKATLHERMVQASVAEGGAGCIEGEFRRQTEEVERLNRLSAVQESQLNELRTQLRSKDQLLQEAIEQASKTSEQLAFTVAETTHEQQAAVRNALHRRFDEQQGEIKSLLDRQGTSILNMAEQQLQGRELQLENYGYELERRDRIVTAMQDEMRKKDENCYHLRSELNKSQEALEIANTMRMVASEEFKADADARVTMTTAHFQEARKQVEVLQERCQKLEELLRQKDDEIRKFRTELLERDESITQAQRQLQRMQFDLDIKTGQVVETEKAAQNKECELSVMMRRMQEHYEKELQDEKNNPTFKAILAEKDRQIDSLTREVENDCQELQSRSSETHRLSMIIQTKEQQNLELRSSYDQLEANAKAGDLSTELLLTRQSEEELRRQLREERATGESMREEFRRRLLLQARIEQAALQTDLVESKSVICRLNEQIVQLKQQDHIINATAGGAVFSAAHPALMDRSFGSNGVCSQPIKNVETDKRNNGTTAVASVGSSSCTSLYMATSPTHFPKISYPSSASLKVAEAPADTTVPQYEAHLEDTLDKMVNDFVKSSGHNLAQCPIRRIDEGLYLIGTRRVSCKILNNRPVVRVGGGLMNFQDFVAAERMQSSALSKHIENRSTPPQQQQLARDDSSSRWDLFSSRQLSTK